MLKIFEKKQKEKEVVETIIGEGFKLDVVEEDEVSDEEAKAQEQQQEHDLDVSEFGEEGLVMWEQTKDGGVVDRFVAQRELTEEEISAQQEEKRVVKEKFVDIEEAPEEQSDGLELDSSRHILYVVSDVDTPNILEYMRLAGLKVTAIYTSLELMRDVMLLPSDTNIRVMILDTGANLFNLPANREIIIDMILSSSANRKVTIFHTIKQFKDMIKQTIELDNKTALSLDDFEYVDFVQYAGTAVTIGTMKYYEEDYVYGDDMQELRHYNIDSRLPRIDTAELLKRYGLTDENIALKRLRAIDLDISEMVYGDSTKYEQLKGFTPNYKR